MTAVFAGQHSSFRLVRGTGLFEVGVDFHAIALRAHVVPRGQDALHVVRVLDHLVVAGFDLGAGGGLGKVDFLTPNLGFDICRSLVAALVVRAGDVSGRSRER